MFYNNYYISNDEIHIIKSAFGDSGSYGSRFRVIFLVNNTYTRPRRCKRDNVTPIRGPVLKNCKKIHNERYSFNLIPPILAEKIINNLTIKASCAPRIIDFSI